MFRTILVTWCFLFSQSSAVYYDFNFYEGSACMTFRGRHGQCTKAVDCYGSNDLGLSKRICYFDGEHVVVCCSQRRLNRIRIMKVKQEFPEDRISQTKFQEYMDLVFGSNSTRDPNLQRIPTLPGEYPHMAAIGYKDREGNVEYKCGGSLISEYFIITAAHCTHINKHKPHTIRIGDLNLVETEPTVEPQDFHIKRMIIHPNYTQQLYYNDIALIELARSIVLTRFVHPACLWPSDILPNDEVIAMGYGTQEFAGRLPNLLTEMELSLVSNMECNSSLPSNERSPNGILSSQICAIDKIGTRDTCQGDSGGPLQLNFEKRGIFYYHIIGITSYGVYYGDIYPGVYTRVSSFIDWIEENVWQRK